MDLYLTLLICSELVRALDLSPSTCKSSKILPTNPFSYLASLKTPAGG